MTTKLFWQGCRTSDWRADLEPRAGRRPDELHPVARRQRARRPTDWSVLAPKSACRDPAPGKRPKSGEDRARVIFGSGGSQRSGWQSANSMAAVRRAFGRDALRCAPENVGEPGL